MRCVSARLSCSTEQSEDGNAARRVAGAGGGSERSLSGPGPTPGSVAGVLPRARRSPRTRFDPAGQVSEPPPFRAMPMPSVVHPPVLRALAPDRIARWGRRPGAIRVRPAMVVIIIAPAVIAVVVVRLPETLKRPGDHLGDGSCGTAVEDMPQVTRGLPRQIESVHFVPGHHVIPPPGDTGARRSAGAPGGPTHDSAGRTPRPW